MNARRERSEPSKEHRLRIFRGEGSPPAPWPPRQQHQPSSTPIFINGYPGEIHSWTREEWDRLHPADRPADALAGSNGVRVALRLA